MNEEKRERMNEWIGYVKLFPYQYDNFLFTTVNNNN